MKEKPYNGGTQTLLEAYVSINERPKEEMR